jgi:phosphoadenosine phosphosulfate reductase
MKFHRANQVIDKKKLNAQLSMLSASQRIAWAADYFKDGLFALTSAGVDSALMLEHLSKDSHDISVIHINTGFLHKETLAFRESLQNKYGFRLLEFGPSQEQINELKKTKLWETDLQKYSKITKLDPLSKAIKELEVSALLTAVRSDQTKNRAKLNYLDVGNSGEIRVHPFLDWTKSQVEAYFDENNLPRHPLYDKGFESVADEITTTEGRDRSGRAAIECGLHVQNGRLVRQN